MWNKKKNFLLYVVVAKTVKNFNKNKNKKELRKENI